MNKYTPKILLLSIAAVGIFVNLRAMDNARKHDLFSLCLASSRSDYVCAVETGYAPRSRWDSTVGYMRDVFKDHECQMRGER